MKVTRGDMFGRPLVKGDLVVIKVRGYQALQLAQVVSTSPKRVRVTRISEKGEVSGYEEQTAMAVFILAAADATDANIKLLAEKARIYNATG